MCGTTPRLPYCGNTQRDFAEPWDFAARHNEQTSRTLASLVQGKSVTGFANSEAEAVRITDVVPFLAEEMLKQCGGIYSKTRDWQSYVVVDGNLVTGQNPASSEAAAKAVLRQLASRPEVMPIGASIGTPAAGAGASVVSRETHNPST